MAFRRHAPIGLVCAIDGKINIVKRRNHPTLVLAGVAWCVQSPFTFAFIIHATPAAKSKPTKPVYPVLLPCH